ncbi:MAG: hypothetical protein CL489_08190 [Acidobacteria bacterium]|nr:hypothetical protein [Acidobacteriota bacterium]|tara:strand:+ start:3623 stop:3886 length:264 start_codon:yes stop_codon:yes gene_type:complete
MNKLLMSRDNHNGWKLEELLQTIIDDLNHKNSLIEHDECEVSKNVQLNNNRIIELLKYSIGVQNNTLDLLDSVGEDEGVTGKPRIGG